MIGPHWFISIFGMGLLGGLGFFIYYQLRKYISIWWKISYLTSLGYTLGTYLWMFGKLVFFKILPY